MSERLRRVGSLLVTLLLAAFVIGAVVTADPPQADRARAIGIRVKCPVCVGETIADSRAGIAQDMMEIVRERIAQGYSDEQIIDELIAAYPGSSLLDPPFSVATLLLWLGPGAVLVAGTVVALRLRRRPGPAVGGRTETTLTGSR